MCRTGTLARKSRVFRKASLTKRGLSCLSNTVPGGYLVSRANLRAGVLAVAVVMLPAEAAQAAAFMVRETSANAVGMASAGLGSRAEDASTVFNNPAGMSFLNESQVQIGSAVVLPDLNFSGTATGPGPTPITGVNDRNIGQTAMIPHLYGAFRIDERWSAGIAMTVPFGLVIDYSENWPGRYSSIQTAALSFDVNPNIAYKINDNVSIGGGFSAQYFKLQMSSAINQALIFGAPGTPDGGYRLTVDDVAWGFNLGILAKVTEQTKLGLTYRSAITHDLTGQLQFWPTTSPLLGLTNAVARAGVNLPASTTLSLTHQLTPNLSVSGDVQFSQWHVLRSFAVNAPPNPILGMNKQYRDTWMVSVGGAYRFDDNWTVRGGVGYDQSPVTDAFRFSGIPDTNRVMVGAGASYNFTPTMGIDVGYAHYFTTDKATMNSSVNAVDPFTGVVLSGQYKNALDYLAISFRSAL
jgi:long-chain fatty acid transport protein